jgi:hypothetical protein
VSYTSSISIYFWYDKPQFRTSRNRREKEMDEQCVDRMVSCQEFVGVVSNNNNFLPQVQVCCILIESKMRGRSQGLEREAEV